MSETITAKTRDYKQEYQCSRPADHFAKCQSPLCVRTREENRVSTREQYKNHYYCLKCRTPYPKALWERFCPCCSNLLRTGPRLPSHKKKDVKRY